MPDDPRRRDFLRRALASWPIAALGNGLALAANRSPQAEADAFLARFVEGWLPLETAAQEAAWLALTDVTEAHTRGQIGRGQALNEFVGAPRSSRPSGSSSTAAPTSTIRPCRQLEKVRLRAAEAPGTLPEVVRARTVAEAEQSAKQDGFTYTLRGQAVSPNQIDRILVESRDLGDRRAAWEASKEVGGPLREGLLRLRDLRNTSAKALGFDSFFALQVADYGLTVPRMIGLCDGFLDDVRPLYQQLHAWAKHELAERYKVEAPKGMIPAHWLPNRWGQNWPGLAEGVDLDAPFKAKSREYITEQAERFYVSLGFPKLPRSFYERSDLYPADPASGRKKNSHASAWHVDLRQDVRSLMSIEPDARWFTTAHHELGHIYYYLSYSRPQVPYLLRAGANRAFHEGIGDLVGLAAGQRPYLKSVGLLEPEAERADPVAWLLEAALDKASVVFLPFSAGVMTPLRARLLRGGHRGRRPERRLVGARRPPPGDRPARPPPRDALRPGHQDAHQRRSRPVLRLRHRHRRQISAPRPHRPRDPPARPPRMQLLRRQARRRLPP